MARLALPESGLTAAVIHPDNPDEASTGEVARGYERNKRLNGTSPLPALLVNPDGTATAIERSPVAITASVDSSASGSEGVAPIVLRPVITGSGWDEIEGTDPGFIAGLNVFATTGETSGDGDGATWLIGVLGEADHLNDATIGNLVGLWGEASFLGSGSNGGHVGGMYSIRGVAPKRKGGATNGTADAVYTLWLDGAATGDLDSAEGYTAYFADGDNVYMTGSAVIAEGVAIASTFPLLIGDAHATDDASGNIVLSSTNPDGGNLVVENWLGFGSFGVRIQTGHGSPNGVVIADIGSIWIDLDVTDDVCFWGKGANNGSAFGWGPLSG